MRVLKYLKNFGYNSRFMETHISDECKALIKLRLNDAGQPVVVNNMFHITILNILWRLVAGKRWMANIMYIIRIMILNKHSYKMSWPYLLRRNLSKIFKSNVSLFVLLSYPVVISITWSFTHILSKMQKVRQASLI